MKNDIKEINLDGDRILLKKSKIFGWGIVKPLKIDGKWNLKNEIAGGSWIKLLFLALFILLIYLSAKEYTNAIKLANDCIQNQNIFTLKI